MDTNTTPSDWHLLNMIQGYIAKNNLQHVKQLYGLSKCTHGGIQMSFPGVFILSNSKHVKAYGARYCHTKWGCPICEPFEMAKRAEILSCAISALKEKPYNQKPIMVTFTVPHHNRSYTCEQTSRILRMAWTEFTKRGTKSFCSKKLKDGTTRYYRRLESFGNFRVQFNIKFYARAYEYTWGINGWHPHIHAIFWIDADKFNTVLEWEPQLIKLWRKYIEQATIKVLTESEKDPVLKEEHTKYIQEMFARGAKLDQKDTRHIGAYISKKDGKPIEQKASMYIMGWGAEKELTGNYQRKASHEGHFTPYEMLLEADANRDKPEIFNKWMKLYIDYIIAARKILNNRVGFGQNAEFFSIIRKWKQTNAYQRYLQKKKENYSKETWYLVYWFTQEQWLSLFNLNLIPYIMAIAHLPNAKEQIDKTLEYYDIKRTHYECEPYIENVSKQILNQLNAA